MDIKALEKMRKLLGEEAFKKTPQYKEWQAKQKKTPRRRSKSPSDGNKIERYSSTSDWTVSKLTFNRAYPKNLMALDPSMSHFGWAVLMRRKKGTRQEYHTVDWGVQEFPGPQELDDKNRLLRLQRWFTRLVVACSPDVVWSERVFIPRANLSRGGKLLIKMEGIIEVVIADRPWVEYDQDTCTIAPTSLKKWATGDGRATKEDMVARANEIWHLEGKQHQVTSDDEADALCLLRFMQVQFGE